MIQRYLEEFIDWFGLVWSVLLVELVLFGVLLWAVIRPEIIDRSGRTAPPPSPERNFIRSRRRLR